MTEEQESWLPNLVGGVSIWKLAPDLNEEQFFDGRLLVPDTEGSDSLPVRVTWDLTGLVPLNEARQAHGEAVRKATEDFFACLERTAAVFEKGGSGYDKYKQAFTVPALDADGGAHYFFDTKSAKLCVINWGASPRKIKHSKEYLFGYQDFGVLIEKAGASLGAGGGGAARGVVLGAAGAAEAGGESAAPEDADAEKKDGEKKDGEKKDEDKSEESTRPWWMWLLYAVGLAFLIWLALMLLRDCQAERNATGNDGGAEAGVDAGLDGAPEAGAAALDGEVPIYGHATDDGGPPATNLHADGSVDGGEAGVPDGSVRDAGIDPADIEPGGEIREPNGRVRLRPPRNRRTGRHVYGQYRDPTGRYYYWVPGEDGGDPVSLPHREHYHPEARQWRIVGGTAKVYDFSSDGSIFHVYLRPGESFDGVHVQWRDAAGNWHSH